MWQTEDSISHILGKDSPFPKIVYGLLPRWTCETNPTRNMKHSIGCYRLLSICLMVFSSSLWLCGSESTEMSPMSYLRSAVQLNKTDCTLRWTTPSFTHFQPSRYVNSSVYLPDSTCVPTLHSLLSPHSPSSPAQPLLPLVQQRSGGLLVDSS